MRWLGLCAVLVAACQAAPAPVIVPRRALAVAELQGRIYATGGWNGSATQLGTVESVDAAGTRGAPPLAIARSQHGLIALDGRLYAVGGWSAERGLLREIETWAPGETAWRTQANLPTPRREPGVAVLGREIVVAGGFNGTSDADLDGYSAVVEAYDPQTGAWRTLAHLNQPRRGLALVNAAGVLYAIGGYIPDDGYLSVVERYDAGQDGWAGLPVVLAPRTWAAALADGAEIVIAGGFNEAGPLTLVERLDPRTLRVCNPPTLARPRAWASAAWLGPRAMLLGGESDVPFSGAVTVFEPRCAGATTQ